MPESARLRIAEIVALADELARCGVVLREEGRRVVQEVLAETQPDPAGQGGSELRFVNPDPGVLDPEQSTAQAHPGTLGELAFDDDAHAALGREFGSRWVDVECAVDEHVSNACDSVHAFVAFAEAEVARYERGIRHRTARAQVGRSSVPGGNGGER